MPEDIKKVKLAIIGRGAAGFSAAIYAGRTGLGPLVINEPEPGDQITITSAGGFDDNDT